MLKSLLFLVGFSSSFVDRNSGDGHGGFQNRRLGAPKKRGGGRGGSQKGGSRRSPPAPGGGHGGSQHGNSRRSPPKPGDRKSGGGHGGSQNGDSRRSPPAPATSGEDISCTSRGGLRRLTPITGPCQRKAPAATSNNGSPGSPPKIDVNPEAAPGNRNSRSEESQRSPPQHSQRGDPPSYDPPSYDESEAGDLPSYDESVEKKSIIKVRYFGGDTDCQNLVEFFLGYVARVENRINRREKPPKYEDLISKQTVLRDDDNDPRDPIIVKTWHKYHFDSYRKDFQWCCNETSKRFEGTSTSSNMQAVCQALVYVNLIHKLKE